MARCLLVVAAALLVLQGSRASLIEDVLSHVGNVTQTVFQDAKKGIENLNKNVVAAGESEITKIHDKVKTVVTGVKNTIDTFLNKTEDAGKKLVKCTTSIPAELLQLDKNLTESAVSCVTTPINEAKSIIVDLTTQVKLVNNTIGGLKDTLTECQKNFIAIPCEIKAGYDALATAATSASTVTGDIVKGTTLVTGFLAGVETCEAAAFASAPIKAKSLISTIVDCYKV